MIRTLCRIAAWAIVVAGLIDPVVALTRPAKPEVALVSDGRLPDPALLARVERALRGQFTVVRGPSLGAGAVVTVGYQMPPESARAFARAFAVVPEPRLPFAAITSIAAADLALLRSRLPIQVGIRAVAARGRTVAVTLRRDGVAIERATKAIASDDARESVELQFTPSATGDAALSVDAQIEDGALATASLHRSVQDDRWSVLFFDRRPSWMSTFVRRALESDPRFVVVSRVATSKSGPAITAGQPPASLSGLPALEPFDTVVVGAPEELTDGDTAGLSGLLRSRGGAVVLLLDEQDPSKQSMALRRLTGVTSWKLTERANPFGAPAASAVLAPAPVPEWLEPVEMSNVGRGFSPGVSVWRAFVGRGTLAVSGALDAWRYRDNDGDSFGVFWRGVIADGARTSRRLAAKVGAASRVEPDERALVRGWVESRNGRVISESTLDQLAPAVAAVLSPSPERQPVRPMHSPWWMAPFAMALGAEWWMRRRGGLR